MFEVKISPILVIFWLSTSIFTPFCRDFEYDLGRYLEILDKLSSIIYSYHFPGFYNPESIDTKIK